MTVYSVTVTATYMAKVNAYSRDSAIDIAAKIAREAIEDDEWEVVWAVETRETDSD